MKKLLPIVFSFIFALGIFLHAESASAATPTNTPTPTATPTPTGPVSGTGIVTTSDDSFTPDANVTFVGQVGARSGQFLDWALENYQWSYNSSVAPFSSHQPLLEFWILIRNIVYALLLLFILASAFILIITRGRNLTLRRFLIRFLLIIVLITFSYYLLQFIYAIFDIIQGFFLKNPDYPAVSGALPFISQKNLLYIGFPYNNFHGFSRVGDQYKESEFITLLLVKLTAITYYVMSGVLLVRKIILWFFIIISPIFPLLLFYSPIRNTAKIWVGEFFRWLLYAPLFAIFLSGLVMVWRAYIPLHFNFVDYDTITRSTTVQHGGTDNTKMDACDPNDLPNNTNRLKYYNCYQTSVNILIGGPGQFLSIDNSVNYVDTFAEYVVSLLMLWVVIILPFILLQIFLDYLNNYSFGESSWVKQIVATGSSYMNKLAPTPVSPPPGSPPPTSTGLARELPFANKVAMPAGEARKITTEEITRRTDEVRREQTNIINSRVNQDILRTANLSVPNLRDIARYESSLLSSNRQQSEEVSRSQEMLRKIANPNLASSSSERRQLLSLRSKLMEQKSQGNPLASSILIAANSTLSTTTVSQTATPSVSVATTPEQRAAMREQAKVNAEIQQIRNQGQAGQRLQQVRGVFPTINRVQTVSIEDYESVKKMWEDTYRRVAPPKAADGREMDRKTWIKNDVEKISTVTNLLVSSEAHKVNEGMDMVARILPFLLIGGFSQTEVVAYLKAKDEAAKTVLNELESKQQEEEETTVDAKQKSEEKPKEMTMEEEAEEKQEPKDLPENEIVSSSDDKVETSDQLDEKKSDT